MRFRILAITPLERPDLRLAQALLRHDVAVAIDIGRDVSAHREMLARIEAPAGSLVGLRIADDVALDQIILPGAITFLVVAGHIGRVPDHWPDLPVIAEVCCVEEAGLAIAAGAAGLIAKGQESGGRVGDESSFVLLQRVLELVTSKAAEGGAPVPVWCQGGIGLNTAAGAVAGGAFGVAIDSILAPYPQSSLPEAIKTQIRAMDGSEVHSAAGYQVYGRGQRQSAEHSAMSAEQARRAIAEGTLLPIGQDAALAALVMEECPSLESLIQSMRMRIAGQIGQARALRVLAEGNAWAQAHGTRYPVAQGPMTRVSDTAAFASAVADAGALPFLALSMMREAPSRALMAATQAALGRKPWGVGVLAFASPEIVEPHLALVREFKPDFLVLAGGRPAQARPFVEMGIPTYLHVPSPGLLDMFLKDGATHFIFEGRECGGHVGPRYSHVLWEQALALLEKVERPENLSILFAGGIHDARSGAMVAAIAARLAARGAKIGVLMGSAYITTQEAVESGAVLEKFQAKALAGAKTVLVETAPGHAIRCLPTGFVDLFERERERLKNAGTERKQVWRALENLTVGRLRIATKGVDYVDGTLAPIGPAQQDAEGMYMLGQVIALRREITGMAALHDDVTNGSCSFLETAVVPAWRPATGAAPIAIIGMACLFPGSPDLEAYWANIVQGRDMVREVPADRWNVAQYYAEAGAEGEPQPGKTISKWGGFIDPTPFDPLKFGIPPQSLAAIEPVQLLSLAVAQQSLCDAGYDTRWFDREKTSVIFGAESGMDLANKYNFRNMYPQYCGALPEALAAALPSLTEDSFPGILVNVISGRIANRLGLGGVNYAVDSACASSLTAIELAVKELRAGSSDMVLAGGADFHNGISDFLMFSSAGALSPTGSCRSFDDRADGICLGEGVGIIVLKRLDEAERDGDRIYAVIEGIAGSSDGKGLGLTAPRREGQRRALERAYWQAGVLPASVGLVEAHGTGTAVGDRTELETLAEVFGRGGAVPGQAGLGSVKSQIGHTKCAAGIAGMIKVAKALHHRVLPPTQNVDQPNAAHRVGTSPFRLDRQPSPWVTEKHRAPLAATRAAVSAFGFGGTNFHAVLAGYAPHHSPVGAAQFPAELFCVRGETMEDAAGILRRIGAFLRQSDAPVPLRDLAQAAWVAGSGPVQLAFVAERIEDVPDLLASALLRRETEELFLRPPAAPGKIACLFAGQGSQYPGMLRDLFVHFPLLQDFPGGHAYLPFIYPPSAYDEATRNALQLRLTETTMAQPALGLVEIAAFRWLEQLGLRPDLAAGHSYGELAALSAAGAFDMDDLLALSRARARCIMDAVGDEPGTMAAVRLDAATLKPLLADFPGVVLANQNSPIQTVISGPCRDVQSACDFLETKGIGARRIAASCAFHSPLMAGAESLYAQVLAGHPVQPLRWPVYSNATAAPLANDANAIRTSLARHIVSPVRFVEEIERMHADGARVFIEIGPRQVLTGLVGRILKGKAHRRLAMDPEARGFAGLFRFLAELAVLLPDFNAAPLFAGRTAPLDLDEPRKLSAATWMIDGGRAWPLHGKLPAHAGTAITAPVCGGPDPAPRLPDGPQGLGEGGAHAGDHALLGYLSNMRDMVNAQRDVLLGYFGAAPTAPAGHRRSALLPALLREERPLAPPKPEAPPPAAQSTLAAPERGRVLLDIVADRTGYPIEMLDLDLDLEADLSIDSIKRVEIIGALARQLDLQSAIGAGADALLEQLAARKTLRAVLAWLDEKLPHTAPQPLAVPKPGGAAPVASASKHAPALRKADLLLDVVSGCTGYPAEMLDLDLDLEADLSIDSIKRTEIAAQFARRWGLGDEGSAAKDALQEGLSSFKTLRAMIGWLEQRPHGPASCPAAPAAVAGDAPATIPLCRYVLRTRVQAAVGRCNIDLAGKRFLLTDDGRNVALKIAARLATHGATAEIVAWPEAGALMLEQNQADGLIHLANLYAPPDGDAAKNLFPLMRTMLMAGAQTVLLATGLGGNAGTAEHLRVAISGGGLAGLIKCAAREFTGTQARAVHLDPAEPADRIACLLEEEIFADDTLREVVRTGADRRVRIAVPEALPHADVRKLRLGPDSVVLLTGGARGITSRAAVALARQTGCTIELVGRSPLPVAPEACETQGLIDPRALRQALLRSHRSARPADIEARVQRILADREMRAAMTEIEAAGGSCRYTALDVRDSAGFAAHIEDIYRRHGRIDGVIHGAGVIEDRLMRDKTVESFARVFDTKVRAATVLHEKIRDDVGFVIFFSSVSSVFGNRGQADYAAANDVLDRLAHHWQARIAGRVVSVNWGPWADTGMVSDALAQDYNRKGIGLVPQDEGVAALLREIASDARDGQVLLMCGEPDRFEA